MKRVAIIQNRFQKGGRMQVMVKVTELLNEMGIIPDFVCFKSNITIDEIHKAYDSNVKLNFREVFVNPKIPFEWNILLFNFLTRRVLKEYDLIINSNNTSFLTNPNLNMISYIHFPRKARVINPKKDIHFPEGENKSLFDYKFDFLKLAQALYKTNRTISKRNLLVANSAFTRDIICDLFDLKQEKIPVIYPPVIAGLIAKSEKDPRLVVSLGRFSKEKRQLEQLKVAKSLPDLKFKLVGFVNSEAYFNELKEFIGEQQITNVELMPNANFDEIGNILSKATYFIHSVRNEPFGITSVQAIQHFCIPIVHDSGGQKEIVTRSELRYNSIEEAISIFKKLVTDKGASFGEINEHLLANVQQFSADTFNTSFRELLKNRL